MSPSDITIIRPIDDQCTNYLLCCNTLKTQDDTLNLNTSRNFYVPTKTQNLVFNEVLNPISTEHKNIVSDLTPSQNDYAIHIKNANLPPTHIQLFFDNTNEWKLIYPFLLSSYTFTLQLVRGIADSYEKSLKCINTAQKEDWCLYNITPKTMIIPLATPYAHKLCISPTNYCLQLSRLSYSNDERATYLFNTILTTPSEDFMYKPVEIYILAHLWKIRGPNLTNVNVPKMCKTLSISYELCDQICEDYMNGLTYIFELMTPVNANIMYKQFFEQANYCVKQLINCPYNFIIQTIIECVLTWDNYSVSIAYINLINIARKSHGCTSNILLDNLINILLKNTSPSVSDRYSIESTMEQYNCMLEDIH
jgi:hypothetical protein